VNRKRATTVVVLFLGCLILVLGLGACGGGGEGDQESPTAGAATTASGGGPVKITVWHSEVAANLDTLEKLVSRYNASQDDVRVELVFQGTDEEVMTKLMASLDGGDLPNIASLSEIHTQRLIDSGAVTPVQQFIDQEDYDLSDLNKNGVKYYTVEGKLWAMPFSISVSMLFYNKVTFREVGLDPEKPPRDLEEVRQVSEKMLKRDANGNITRAGIALDIVGWYLDFTLAEHGDFFANNENGRAGRATEVLFNGPTGQAFFQWWHDMVESGLALNVGRNPTFADTLMAVATGRAGMTLTSSAALRSVLGILEGNPEGIDWELGVAMEPGVPGGTGLPGLFVHVLWILSSHPKEEQEAAWKFVKWLVEPEQQAEWYAGSGWIPANVKALDLPAAKEVEAKYPQFKIAADLCLSAPSTPTSVGALLGPFTAIREAVVRGIEEMVVGGKDPIAAINDAAKEANDLLQDYNSRVE
jgi:sn-glycerol 3-phosphate transport system substrate-binding protein